MLNPDPLIKPWRNKKYRKGIEQKRCLATSEYSNDSHHVIAHHVTLRGQGKMGGKVHDYLTVPLKKLSHTSGQHTGHGVSRVRMLESVIDSMMEWQRKRLKEEDFEWLLEDVIKSIAPFFQEEG